jgi:hypothetical protein
MQRKSRNRSRHKSARENYTAYEICSLVGGCRRFGGTCCSHLQRSVTTHRATRCLTTANTYSENVAVFKYLGTTATSKQDSSFSRRGLWRALFWNVVPCSPTHRDNFTLYFTLNTCIHERVHGILSANIHTRRRTFLCPSIGAHREQIRQFSRSIAIHMPCLRSMKRWASDNVRTSWTLCALWLTELPTHSIHQTADHHFPPPQLPCQELMEFFTKNNLFKTIRTKIWGRGSTPWLRSSQIVLRTCKLCSQSENNSDKT